MRFTLGLVLLAGFLGLCIVCYHLASGTHFLVTDAVGDSREIQDFQVSTSFWQDWLGYLPFYIPTAIIGLVALLMGYGSLRLLKTPRLQNNHGSDISVENMNGEQGVDLNT